MPGRAFIKIFLALYPACAGYPVFKHLPSMT